MANHLADIESGNVTKTNLIGLRKALGAEYKATHWGWNNRLKLQGEALREAMAALHTRKPLVRGELHESGVRLVTSPRWRKRFADVQHVIDTLHGFRLSHFEDMGRGHFVPVFQAVGESGSFYFRNPPWQLAMVLGIESGPEVITIC